MILVCNHLQNDLTHANQYIRGSTLRLLCKIQETEILEQVIPQILQNLEHRHSFVRKNAALAVWKVVDTNPQLIPDASDRLETLLRDEVNDNVKRNGFLALYKVDLKKSLQYLNNNLDKLAGWKKEMQLVALELIRKSLRSLRNIPKGVYIAAAHQLLQSSSNIVVFESANTLVSLTNLQSAVKASVSALTKLLQTESDQNIKMIILTRLHQLKGRYNLGNHVMDILRALSTPNNDVRKKVLNLIVDLTSTSNIDNIIGNLKRELTNIENSDGGTNEEDLAYKNLLVETIHECAVKFPNVGQTVVEVLLDFLGDQGGTAKDVILFVREFVQKHADLRTQVVEKLKENMPNIREPNVYRTALWIISEYSFTEDQVQSALDLIFQEVGDLPLKTEQDKDPSKESDEPEAPQYKTQTVVLKDGTYAQETIQVNSTPVQEEEQISNLRKHLLNGAYFLSVALIQCITKLTLRLSTTKNNNHITKLWQKLC
eukprot:UN33704